jgi:hypothetical protein
MPVVKRGFLFKHFEKFICAIAALAFLFAVVYAIARAGALSREVPPEKVERDLELIAEGMRGEADPVQKRDYLEQILARVEELPPALPMRAHVFFPPVRTRDGQTTVATDTEFVVSFDEPVTPGTVRIVGEEELVQVVEHPVEGDYRKVRLRSRSEEGAGLVVGETPSGDTEYAVVIRRGVGKTAHPPREISVVDRQGGVTLGFEPDPRNEDIRLVGYEVWRRDWDDPLGEYRKVTRVTGQSAAARPAPSRSRRRPTGPPAIDFGAMAAARAREAAERARREAMARAGGAAAPSGPMRPGVGRPTARPAAEAAPEELTWRDASVSPGKTYSYKARTVGADTYPEAGEFGDPILVRVPPNVDFQFTRSTIGKVGFEVAKLFTGGTVKKASFWTSVGDEIGGVEQDSDTGEVLNYRTGMVMVDFHRAVLLPGTGVTDRVVYADREGNLHERLREETGSDLWEMLKEQESAPTRGPLRRRTGRFMPSGPLGGRRH